MPISRGGSEAYKAINFVRVFQQQGVYSPFLPVAPGQVKRGGAFPPFLFSERRIDVNADNFRQMVLDNSEIDYGMCPPPTKAQDGLSILMAHFLGEDWYTVFPLNQEQANTEAIYEILRCYPTKKDKKERLRKKLIHFVDKLFKTE